MLKQKYEALKNFFIETGEATAEELTEELEAVYNDSYGTFEILGGEYRVLTDEEADEATAENIKDSLWAFNADFILKHTEAYKNTTDREDAEIIKALQMIQSSICESANSLVLALISDIEEFIEDAIDADGRGHFLATYDGQENGDGKFYIYRTN